MSHNTFGHLFRVTTWGESHGPAIGCVVDGCPPGLPLEAAEHPDLPRQAPPGPVALHHPAPGAGRGRILSGVFDDEAGRQVTTGTPISLQIDNVDQRSKDYGDIKDKFRPGHADYTYLGQIRHPRLPRRGRASARETAMRVAAGAIARKVIAEHERSAARWSRSAASPSTARSWDWDEVDANPFFCPDAEAAVAWADYLDEVRKAGSSIGAIIEVVAEGVPAGLGAPIYGKLDQDIAAGMMSINAVKGVEIGAGMAAAELTGEENADEIRMRPDGEPVPDQQCRRHPRRHLHRPADRRRFAVKPTSSILTPRNTIDRDGNETEISTKGRHDPCVGIRAVPIGEAMMAIVLADHFLRHRGQTGKG